MQATTSLPDAGRHTLLFVLALGAAMSLRVVDPVRTSVLVVVAALLAAFAAGRLARRLGLPDVVGYLGVGALLGPFSGFLAAALPLSFVLPQAILSEDLLARSESLRLAALALGMIAVGRTLGRRPTGGHGALIGAVTLTSLAALGLLTAVAGALALSESLGSQGAGALLRDVDDALGLGVAMIGSSTMLVAAVIHSGRAEGPVATIALRLAALTELLALLLMVVWSTLGAQGLKNLALAEPGSVAWVGFALLLGALVGALLALGARWAPSSAGAWVLGMVALTTVAASEAWMDIPLFALATGMTFGVLVRDLAGATLRRAEGLAHLVLFTLAGSLVPLHLILPLLPLALAVAIVRGATLAFAATWASRRMGAIPNVARFAWLGLLPSAIPVAGLLSWEPLGDRDVLGAALNATLWGVSTLDGLAGSVLLYMGLRAAGELPDYRRPQLPAPPDGSWVAPSAFPHGPLRQEVGHLESDLRSLARDFRRDLLEPWKQDITQHLGELRRELRRQARRQQTAASADPSGSATRTVWFDALDRIRSLVLGRASQLTITTWSPVELANHLQHLADLTAELVQADATQRDPWRGPRQWLSFTDPAKRVPMRSIVSVHLRGAELEPVAAALVHAELHLLNRTRDLALALLNPAEVEHFRDDVAHLQDELDALLDVASDRLEATLQRAVTGVAVDLAGAEGSGVPPSPINTTALHARWRDTLRAIAASERTLALELELVGYEQAVEAALAEHGAPIARLVRGRGNAQLKRVEQALDTSLIALEGHLSSELNGTEMAEALREEADALIRTVTDAARSAEELREQLASPHAASPLLDALGRAGQQLSESYEVLATPLVDAVYRLPRAAPSIRVAFREVVQTWLESRLTRELVAVTRRYATKLDRLTQVVEGLERVVSFNVELAVGELLAVGEAEVPPEVRRAARETALEGVERNRGDLARIAQESGTWFPDIERNLRDAVLGHLRDLRARASEGRFPRGAWDAGAGGDAFEVEQVTDTLARWRLQLSNTFTRLVGRDRIDNLRKDLGLKAEAPDALTPARFVAPAPQIDIPLIYRRLFSERALDAGELVGNRKRQADQVRDALSRGAAGKLRTVAVVGPDGTGQRAIIQAATRTLRVRAVHRVELTAPTSVAEVEEWFNRGAQNHLFVLSGLHWLYRLDVGGFDPLHAFVQGVVRDAGRNAWLIDVEDEAWTFAAGISPLRRAFPTEVRIEPLDDADLELAILARHRISGYALRFASTPDADERKLAAAQRRWFAELHAATGGIARDAHELWLAAITEVDTAHERVTLGPLPTVPLAAMRRLTDRSTLALRVATRQGWLDAATYGRLFREDALNAESRVASLKHWGLLVQSGEHLVLPHHLRRLLRQVCSERGWS